MPSRRSLLAASGTAAATALAGCSALGSPEGSPAEVVSGRDLRPRDGEVVARLSAGGTGCPDGDVTLSALAVERGDETVQTLTTVEVFAGERACGSDWGHDGVEATHDWAEIGLATEGAVTDTASNVRYTDSGGDVRLRDTGSSGSGEWHVRRTAAGAETERYEFRSTFTFGSTGGDGLPASEGDELATVTVEVPLSTAGLIGGDSAKVSVTETLVYGEALPAIDQSTPPEETADRSGENSH